MIWLLAILDLAVVLASALVRSRMFLYRHDQKWRRERGAAFGDEPPAIFPWDIYRESDYSPAGRRLLPIVFTLQIIAIALFISVVALL
ncbi:MAG TPA: hypothetical protein VLN49_24605 [Gemmatimonadaceae bacterium]|nr:hypothetical protein [Gemmatimonadaceae bacterium]